LQHLGTENLNSINKNLCTQRTLYGIKILRHRQSSATLLG
jgi:hypothetical protein